MRIHDLLDQRLSAYFMSALSPELAVFLEFKEI